MSLRLRQIALVAQELESAERVLADVFSLEVCYRDPAVGEFGLENCLFPIGNQFLEVVAPIEKNTHAGRFLERRKGEGGYMVITQCRNHQEYKERVNTLGVRIAHQFSIENFVNMQLHPRDTGGSFFEIDQQLPTSGEETDPWAPAGAHWRDYVNTERAIAIASVEMQCDDPQSVADRWGKIAGIKVENNNSVSMPQISLENATLKFCECDDGRPEGLSGVEIVVNDEEQVLSAAAKNGAEFSEGYFLLNGIRWSLRKLNA